MLHPNQTFNNLFNMYNNQAFKKHLTALNNKVNI